MPEIRERPGAKLAERTVIEKYDHDCEDGHGPGCRPFETLAIYQLDGQAVTDPETIARLEAQMGGQ